MKYTNKLNLPAPLVAALKHDEYDAGHSDYTPSSLLRPAYMAKLEETHEPESDVADMVYSMMGKAIHNAIQISGRGEKSFFSEERIYMKFQKWTISMQFDSLYLDAKTGILDDYKSSTVYKFTKDNIGAMQSAPDWEFQLNMGAYILRKGGYTTSLVPMSKNVSGKAYYKIAFSPIHINQIRIIGILKDFYKSKARRDKNYPQHPIQIRNFSIWSDDKIEEEISWRAVVRDKAKISKQEEITPCSKEEIWATEDKWALMKKNRKKAVKLFTSVQPLRLYALEKDFAETLMDNDGGIEFIKGHYMQFRPGERKRCDGYCAVSKFCPDYKKFLEGKNET